MTQVESAEPEEIETRHLIYTGAPERAAVLTNMLRHEDVSVALLGPYDYQDVGEAEPLVTAEIVVGGPMSSMTRVVDAFLARAKGRATVTIRPAIKPRADFTYGNVRVISKPS